MSNYTILKASILDVLRYFHIFKFPLTLFEIHRFCSIDCKIEELEEVLQELLNDKDICQIDSYYLLENKPKFVQRKLEGAHYAQKKLKEAARAARIINLFPFVRMVSLSGSLSKGYFEKGSDIDFFIITEKNRLWICRSILHLFKKLTFLVGKQHNYCMNYFIDETSLEIDEKNQYTAMEVVTLIPQTNSNLYKEFLLENKWVNEFAPNSIDYLIDNMMPYKTRGFKRLMEKLLNSARLNTLLMKLTDKKWRFKWSRKGFDMSKYDMAFKTTINISKNHPHNYGEKVIKQLNAS